MSPFALSACASVSALRTTDRVTCTVNRTLPLERAQWTVRRAGVSVPAARPALSITKCRRGSPLLIVRSTRRHKDFEDEDGDEESDEEEDTEEDEEEPYMDEDVHDWNMEPDSSMRLYLDSANVKEWKKWAEAGIFYGFTTNPTILKKSGVACTIQSMRHLAREAFDLPHIEELQLQAWGSTPAEIYSCGMDLYELDSRVVVKVPLTLDGLKAVHMLGNDGVPFTLTGLYSGHQIATAMAAGAMYAAPYLGRMNDACKNGQEIISQMQSILDMSSNVEGQIRLLVASIRKADEIAELAAEGCNTFTISPAVAMELVSDPLTLEAADVFEKHAKEMSSVKGR